MSENERFDTMLKRLKAEAILDTGGWEEVIPDDIWLEFFRGNHKVVAKGLDVDTHRCYETSTTVVRVEGGLLGINHITNIFSESMCYSDCGIKALFCEMQEKKTITYVPKDIPNDPQS